MVGRSWFMRPPRLPARDDRGMTLVEMLVAMLLFAALVAIGWRQLTDYRWRVHAALVQSDLRNLALHQELYISGGRPAVDFAVAQAFAPAPANRRYASSLDELDFTASPGVQIKLRASHTGWAARGWHERLVARGYFCAIFIGDAQPFTPAVEQGVIACATLAGVTQEESRADLP